MQQTTTPPLPRRAGVPRNAPGYDDETRRRARPARAGAPPAPAPDRPAAPADSWPGRFAQALAETLAGGRPAAQLTPWTSEQARKRIAQLGPRLATSQRPRVRRVMSFAPASGVLEVTAVVGFGPRTTVLALRLEQRAARGLRGAGAGSWYCTAIESA